MIFTTEGTEFTEESTKANDKDLKKKDEGKRMKDRPLFSLIIYSPPFISCHDDAIPLCALCALCG
jgi:hypothetical protein